MTAVDLDYNRVAGSYDERYALNALDRVERALASLVRDLQAGRVLEVGCGTGRWLDRSTLSAPLRVGIDRSLGMLRIASGAVSDARLICADASRLPVADRAFDLVMTINAVHQFGDARGFIRQAAGLVRPAGVLTVVSMDPHRLDHRWYLYDYFAGTRQADLRRYPGEGALRGAMKAAGCARVECRVVERIAASYRGRQVLDDHFLRKSASSQLMRLPDTAYAEGLVKLRRAVEKAEADHRTIEFPVELTLIMVTGWLSSHSG